MNRGADVFILRSSPISSVKHSCSDPCRGSRFVALFSVCCGEQVAASLCYISVSVTKQVVEIQIPSPPSFSSFSHGRVM
ncbi:hypothetical protein EYF80_014416 [Liparis tanakae]|uniref:Uncharacterized protein n=1 Tax=Liparis tanakae TaxID=230148 RepID=A0A4Z2IBB5_9TELE|nr:hypothetical protein EYF80_014416 [Liparis tanakae]